MYRVVMKRLMQALPEGRSIIIFDRGDCLKYKDCIEFLFPADSLFEGQRSVQRQIIVGEDYYGKRIAVSDEFLFHVPFEAIDHLYVSAQLESIDDPVFDVLVMHNVQSHLCGSRGYREINLLELAKQTGVSVKLLARHAEKMVFRFQDGLWSVVASL